MRDPRIDPASGDVLGKQGCKPRRVTYAAGEWKGFPNVVRYTDGIVDLHCVLPRWRRWAKNAVVMRTEDQVSSPDLGIVAE